MCYLVVIPIIPSHHFPLDSYRLRNVIMSANSDDSHYSNGLSPDMTPPLSYSMLEYRSIASAENARYPLQQSALEWVSTHLTDSDGVPCGIPLMHDDGTFNGQDLNYNRPPQGDSWGQPESDVTQEFIRSAMIEWDQSQNPLQSFLQGVNGSLGMTLLSDVSLSQQPTKFPSTPSGTLATSDHPSLFPIPSESFKQEAPVFGYNTQADDRKRLPETTDHLPHPPYPRGAV